MNTEKKTGRGRRPIKIEISCGVVVNKSNDPEYYKKYFREHKDKIYRRVVCDCGLETSYNNMTNHKRSKKHLSRKGIDFKSIP